MIRGKKNYQWWDGKLVGLLILGIVVSGLTATNILLTQKNQEPPSLANDCTGDGTDRATQEQHGCFDGGGLTNGCNWVCQSPRPPGIVLSIPSCCDIVASTGDPHACCFDALRRCTQSQCDAIPEDQRQSCNGPCRCGQLRALGWDCSTDGGGGPAPTNPPGPTNPPNSTPNPTNKPLPTSTPVPYRSPTPFYIPVTATPVPFVTNAINPTPIIIYITTTPKPTTITMPLPLRITPTSAGGGVNPITTTWDNLTNFLGILWQNISRFTKEIAP